MTITIPDNALAEANIQPNTTLVEFAAFLYEKKTLSIGQAGKISGMGLLSFQQELAKRGIYIHYDTADTEKELLDFPVITSNPHSLLSSNPAPAFLAAEEEDIHSDEDLRVKY